jgi:hypothetical protein
MLTVFFFAPLWRRPGVLTDMEFAEIRYSGKPSSFLRGFRAMYLVLVVNTLTMGWVNFAMATILRLTLGLGKLEAVFICLGMNALADKVHEADKLLGRDSLALVPVRGSGYFFSFLVLLSVNWWSGSYPGAEPGGGGYITQRIFSAKDEKNSLAATLWFNVAHYALRPWPWILTALVALVVLPNTQDKEDAYITVMILIFRQACAG